MIYCGIDPGLTGAVVAINGDNVYVYDTPVLTVTVGKSTKNKINTVEAADILRMINPGYVVIEKVQAMPGDGQRSMGATSAFNFGMGFGIWLGIIAALNIPHEQVHPATWKKKMMNGMAKGKDASRVRALELFPVQSPWLGRKKDHGRAEALLLAEYGRSANHYK